MATTPIGGAAAAPVPPVPHPTPTPPPTPAPVSYSVTVTPATKNMNGDQHDVLDITISENGKVTYSGELLGPPTTTA